MDWKEFINGDGPDVDDMMKGGRTLTIRLSSGLSLRGRLLAEGGDSPTDPLLVLEERADKMGPTGDVWVVSREAVEAICLSCDEVPASWDGFKEALKEE